jgi:hypothetical protein
MQIARAFAGPGVRALVLALDARSPWINHGPGRDESPPTGARRRLPDLPPDLALVA